MKAVRIAGALALAAALIGTAQAQTASSTAPLSRAQVKMERDDFLRTHRWDEPTDTWVLKSGVEVPPGVRSRAEVKAERDKFMAANRWNNTLAVWEPVKEGPRELSKLPRAEVKADTQRFLKTHRWSEETGAWVERGKAVKP